MNELMSLLGKVAPWIAAAATGPAGLAGMAIKTAAEALGASGADAGDVTAALVDASPEQISALRVASEQQASLTTPVLDTGSLSTNGRRGR